MKQEKKYTVNVAYTTPSGRMHVGHGLGLVISDAIMKYNALKSGKKTFFGFGMHSTGKDLIKILEKLKDNENFSATQKRYNISNQKRDEILSWDNQADQIESLVQEYRGQYQDVMQKLDISMDYNTFFSTNQGANQRFTQWTLNKLLEKGLIVDTLSERPYCNKCEDIKHIDKDLSEVSAVGKVDWDNVRVADGMIYGGEFECRLHSGEKIIVKETKERAINYGDSTFIQKTLNLLENLRVYPKKYKSDLEKIIKTRMAKPFERKFEDNIGAVSPFDSTKKIEALADSNIYMEFFGISQLINDGKLNVKHLTNDFFNYIYLSEGNPNKLSSKIGLSVEEINKTKKHIENVTPVEVSIVGYEHLGVHAPFSLFTHAAVLPDNLFFKEYIITSHITIDGEKMSTSKGNVVYLDDILDETRTQCKLEDISEDAKLDAVKFFLAYYQNLDKDFDWNNENFHSSGIKGLKRYVNSIRIGFDRLNKNENSQLNSVDKWFSTLDQKTIESITSSMEERNLRGALVDLVDIRGKALNIYSSLEESNSEILSRFLVNQINMGYPIMRRVTEEMREKYVEDKDLEWPIKNNELVYSEDYELIEYGNNPKTYVKNLVGEINSTLGKMFGKKELKQGDKINIIAPTKHQIKVIKNKRIPLANKISIEFSIDPKINNIEIRREE